MPVVMRPGRLCQSAIPLSHKFPNWSAAWKQWHGKRNSRSVNIRADCKIRLQAGCTLSHSGNSEVTFLRARHSAQFEATAVIFHFHREPSFFKNQTHADCGRSRMLYCVCHRFLRDAKNLLRGFSGKALCRALAGDGQFYLAFRNLLPKDLTKHILQGLPTVQRAQRSNGAMRFATALSCHAKRQRQWQVPALRSQAAQGSL